MLPISLSLRLRLLSSIPASLCSFPFPSSPSTISKIGQPNNPILFLPLNQQTTRSPILPKLRGETLEDPIRMGIEDLEVPEMDTQMTEVKEQIVLERVWC